MSGALIISGPSGIGKDHISRYLLNEYPDTFGHVVLSCVPSNARPIRPGEIDGVHYHFLDMDQYYAQKAAGKLIMTGFFGGCYRGTNIDSISAVIKSGRIPVFTLYSPVYHQLKHVFPDSLAIFLYPGNNTLLKERMRLRGDEENIINDRMGFIRDELVAYYALNRRYYDAEYGVTNNDITPIVQWALEAGRVLR